MIRADIRSRLRAVFPYCCAIPLGAGNQQEIDWITERLGEDILRVHSNMGAVRWPVGVRIVPSGREWGYYINEFYFNDERDAIEFKLRWG